MYAPKNQWNYASPNKINEIMYLQIKSMKLCAVCQQKAMSLCMQIFKCMQQIQWKYACIQCMS